MKPVLFMEAWLILIIWLLFLMEMVLVKLLMKKDYDQQ